MRQRKKMIMKLPVCILVVGCCLGLCSCVECPPEQSATEITIVSSDDKKTPVVNVQMTTVSYSSRPDGKQEKIQQRPENLPKPATVAEDKKNFL